MSSFRVGDSCLISPEEFRALASTAAARDCNAILRLSNISWRRSAVGVESRYKQKGTKSHVQSIT